EACAPGVPRMSDDTSIDLRKAPTYIFLAREKRILVQDDLLSADPAPPIELIERYGARAQMLAPVLVNDTLIGVISVHDSHGPRTWTPEDLSALDRATNRVKSEIAP